MAETATKLPVGREAKADRPAEWRPFESLRREVDRLFEDFQLGSWRSPFGRSLFDVQPFWRGEVGWGKAPAVDIVEKEKAYEVTAELPGMDESNIDVKFSDGTLTIKGEKRDEKEEKKKDYYLSERRYGSFQRSFGVPDGRRLRQPRGKFQEWRAHRHAAEDGASTEKRKEDRDQSGVICRDRSLQRRHLPPLRRRPPASCRRPAFFKITRKPCARGGLAR